MDARARPQDPSLSSAVSAAAGSSRQEVAASRALLLSTLSAPAGDLTFVRGVGNLGDELIFAGTRRLLAGLSYREVGLGEVRQASGHTALLSGSGAWCGPFHELLPQLLPLIELRFERVVVLPSSFDLSVAEVRHALAHSRAVVFARERESFRQIRDLCDARLAHDCAFFFDYAPFHAAGRGTLQAFRTDAESLGGPLPEGNVDISQRCSSLDDWLWTVARHAVVRTDRAHVMIAAALLGKRVEYRPSTYHKVAAIADFALGDRDVQRIDSPVATPARAARGTALAVAAPGSASPAVAAAPVATASPTSLVPSSALPAVDSAAVAAVRQRLVEHARRMAPAVAAPGMESADGGARLTVLVVTHDRPALWNLLFRSLREHARMPFKVLVADNASPPRARAELDRHRAEMAAPDAAGRPGVRVEILDFDRNLGCAVARQRALRHVDSELVMLLDDDAEILPGTLERLVAALDADAAALAAGGHVVLPDGTTQFCGGEYWQEADGVLHFEPLGQRLQFDDPALGPTRRCQWLGCAGVVFRRAALEREPLDLGMSGYYEDNEWFFRVGRGTPGAAFLCVPEALVLHHQELKGPRDDGPEEIRRCLPFLQSIAHFHRIHGRVLEGVFVFAPGLATGGQRDVAAARLLLELLADRGPDWLGEQWLGGGLAPLFRRDRDAEVETLSAALAAAQQTGDAARLESRTLAADLAAARARLTAIYESRLWRGADLYWRLRRAFGRSDRRADDRRGKE